MSEELVSLVNKTVQNSLFDDQISILVQMDYDDDTIINQVLHNRNLLNKKDELIVSIDRVNKKIIIEENIKNELSLDSEQKILDRRFKIALSFPGEYRAKVKEVASFLSNNLGMKKIFYDEFFEEELAKPNMDLHLQEIYRNDSDLIIVFICKEYSEKEWCGLEWRAIRDLIKDSHRKDDEIMFIRLDDNNQLTSGMFSIDGYINGFHKTANALGELILSRYNKLNKKEVINENIENPTIKKNTRSGYVKITLIYKGNRYKTSVNLNAKFEDLVREFKNALALFGEYKMVALTHLNLVENSEWELIPKEQSSVFPEDIF